MIIINFIHCDTDLYQPTKITLKHFWDLLENGSMIWVHDYDTRKWPGVSCAVDEFKKNKSYLTYVFGKKVSSSIVIMKNNDNKYNSKMNEYIKYIENEIKNGF